ncbi:hypothetical protein D3C81_1100740 [compost metagenome]
MSCWFSWCRMPATGTLAPARSGRTAFCRASCPTPMPYVAAREVRVLVAARTNGWVLAGLLSDSNTSTSCCGSIACVVSRALTKFGTVSAAPAWCASGTTRVSVAVPVASKTDGGRPAPDTMSSKYR